MFGVDPRDPYGADREVLWMFVVPLGVGLVVCLFWLMWQLFQ